MSQSCHRAVNGSFSGSRSGIGRPIRVLDPSLAGSPRLLLKGAARYSAQLQRNANDGLEVVLLMIWRLDYLRLTGFVNSSLDQGALEEIFRRVTERDSQETIVKKVPPMTLLTGESKGGARAEVRGLTDRFDVILHLEQLSVSSEQFKELAATAASAFGELEYGRIALAAKCVREFSDRGEALKYLKSCRHAWLESVPDQAEDVLVRLNIRSQVGELPTNRLVEWSVASLLMLEFSPEGHTSRNSFMATLSLDLNNPAGTELSMAPRTVRNYWSSLADEAERIMAGQY